jgi:hypothetical protein
MKRLEAVVATTNVDSHGERMTRGALDSLVVSIAQAYIPIGIEHDPRIPPQGRIASGFVRERPDGEFEAVTIMEVFEEDDDLSSVADAREIVIPAQRANGLTVSHDWTHRSDEDQADIDAIADVLKNEPVYEAKKAADPISIIAIAGAFVLGGIASGVLGQIGVDGWNIIKEKLGRLFARKHVRTGEQLLIFRALLKVGEKRIEVEAILTNPTPEELDRFLAGGLPALDRVLPIYLNNSPDIRRLVLAAKGDELELLFAVRKDCSAAVATVQVKDILGNTK